MAACVQHVGLGRGPRGIAAARAPTGGRAHRHDGPASPVAGRHRVSYARSVRRSLHTVCDAWPRRSGGRRLTADRCCVQLQPARTVRSHQPNGWWVRASSGRRLPLTGTTAPADWSDLGQYARDDGRPPSFTPRLAWHGAPRIAGTSDADGWPVDCHGGRRARPLQRSRSGSARRPAGPEAGIGHAASRPGVIS